jgi:diguanylate cyclase (GGDEF)-like protein
MDKNKAQNKLSFLRPQKLGDRLAWYFISIGLVFTLAVSIALIEYEHIKYTEQVERDSRETVRTIKDQLERSLWSVDDESAQILLDGLARSPSIKGISLVDESGVSKQLGSFTPPADFSEQLTYDSQVLGSLQVEINDTYLDENFIDRVKLLGLSAAIFIGVFGCFLQIIVRRLVTDHLTVISRATADPERMSTKSYQPIILKRPPINDELTDLVEALNEAQKDAIDFKQARESYENQLEYQANNDALTLLPNRRHIDRHLSKEMELISHNSSKERLVIFFIDLDGFKEVNDSLGHSVGDRVLQASAKRLKEIVASNTKGYVARFGGDEFIAACECDSKQEAEIIAEKIIGSFRENFAHNDAQLQLGCSLGVVFFPDHGTTTEELIRKADTAMYKAKEAGRNTFAFFEQSMLQDVMLKNTIKNKLQTALEEERLEIHYQPLINLRDMSISGFEALLRWEDKELGKVAPDLFIPIAEQTGLVFSLDQWVLKTGSKQVKKWREYFDRPFTLSVNFSPTNFHHRQFMPWLEDELAHHGDLEWVELEVTERLVLNYDESVLKGIEEMLKLGLSFSIDDFGTGYSSLGYIKKFSHILSKVKIDRLFVQEIINHSSDRALVQSIVTLADSLNIEILAEGVESRRQEEVLLQLGCDYAQGYLYGKPMSITDIPDFIDAWYKKPRIVRKN